MKRLGLAAADAVIVAKAERHRRNSWCRLWNGFFDAPILRVVAELAGVPLYQVQAFVGRRESFANAAEPRGYVGDFNAAEFAAATGMSGEEAARIFAALEDQNVRWIDQDHVALFWDRNRDREDNTVNERRQRSRDRAKVRSLLADRAHQGLITAEQRDSVEAILELFSDQDLAAFKTKLRRGTALEPALSTCHSVTAVTAGLLWIKSAAVDDAGVSGLSTGHGGHNVTFCDRVTVPPRANQKSISAPVDNSGDGAGGEAQGLPQEGASRLALTDIETAELWLATEGKRIVVERLQEVPGRAETRIQRWLREIGGDVCALAEIIDRASMSDLVVSRFLVTVSEAVERHRREQKTLLLGPALAADNRRKGHG